MATPHDPTGSFSPLDAAIAVYLEAVDAGRMPDRREFLERYPEFVEPLRAFFEDFDRMDRAASPLRLDGDRVMSDESTNGRTETVRYFGDYELLEEVARGGMGVVYRARQVSLNRVVALKMVLAGSLASSRDVQRFRLEAEAAANLDHPHIVPIYEVGEHDGQQYYSMKLIEGTSLGVLARRSAREEVAGLLPVVRAVHHAHQHGVLHRDLKPSNLLVDSKGNRLVTDFGLAKRLADVDGSLTESGAILGTPRYMAPEQAAGRRDLSVAADVYSLGAILYERVTGRPPFLADNVLTLLHQVRESDPPRPSWIVPGIGRELETIVLKCLDKAPSRRYATAEALAEDLENWLTGKPIAARPVGRFGRAWRWCKRNPVVSALMAAVAALIGLGTIVSIGFALRAEARALDAGLAATRSSILVADITSGGDPDALTLLSCARAFRQAPAHPAANDLRRYIAANLELLGRHFHNFLPPLEGAESVVEYEAPRALSPDGRIYAALSPDGRIRHWNSLSGRLMGILHDARPSIRTIEFSPDGRFLAAIQRSWRLFQNGIQVDYVLLRDRRMTILADQDIRERDTVRIWDIPSGRGHPPVGLGPNARCRFSPDSKTLIIQHENKGKPSVGLWNTADGRLVAQYSGCSYPESGWNSRDGRIISLNGSAGEKLVIDTERAVILFRINAGISTFSHSGREIAGIQGDRISFWMTESGRPCRPSINLGLDARSRDSRNDPGLLRYSPSDRFLIVANGVIELATGRKVEVFGDTGYWEFPDDECIAYSKDGRSVVDLTTLRPIPRPIAGRFHPSLIDHFAPGRLFWEFGTLDNPIAWDLRTELRMFSLDNTGTLEGLEWPPRKHKNLQNFIVRPINHADYYSLFAIPTEMFATEPDLVGLWAEVLSRHRLVDDLKAVPLDEAEWEIRRKTLADSLPKSPSPILTIVAEDRLHWLRQELRTNLDDYYTYDSLRISERDFNFFGARASIPLGVQDHLERRLGLLDRLIAAEPRWWYRHVKGETLAVLGRADAAAGEVVAAARLAGDWYWRGTPAILDSKTFDRLLLSDSPETIVRDDLKLGDKAVEVIQHHLDIIRRSPTRSKAAAYNSLVRHGLPAGVYRKALEFTLLPNPSETDFDRDQIALGLANFRQNRPDVALDILSRAEPRFAYGTVYHGDPADSGEPINHEFFAAQAIVHQRLGHTREAGDCLVKAQSAAPDSIERDSDGKVTNNPLLAEAEWMVLDHGFPADPFSQ